VGMASAASAGGLGGILQGGRRGDGDGEGENCSTNLARVTTHDRPAPAADVNPFENLDTATVLQQCRAFHDPEVVSRHPRRCCEILTRLLYLMAQGFRFTTADSASVFFGVTKLFSSDNWNLRRLVYLFLKEVAETSSPDTIIIVLQSLIKDFNETSHEILQSNALRVLTRIVDSTTLNSLDRYYREAVVDTSAVVAAAGLTSGLYLLRTPGTTDIVKRWVGEIQTRMTAREPMVRFHAMCLLHSLKASDNLGISRLLSSQIAKADFSSTLGVMVLVRYTSALLSKDFGAIDPRQAYEFLDSCTHCASSIVRLEAARAICRLPSASASDIRPAIVVLKAGLLAKSAAHRFSCVRTLAQIAQTYPAEVEVANDTLEGMLTDSRIIATYAIVTLLKTGSGSSIARLLKHIHGFLSDLSDDFKVVIAHAVHDMALRFSSSFEAILNFVSTALREEGSFEYKRALVDIKVDLMERVPECRSAALSHLCEFIEDCEFTPLCTRVLHLLGDMGPTLTQPEALIRFIYNRLLLEGAPVRAAAVTSLAKFGAAIPRLRPSVITLLRRVKHDDDDEVRDRCALSISSLEALEAETKPSADLEVGSKALAFGALPMSVSALQKALRLYQLHPSPGPFSFADLPAVDGVTGTDLTYHDVARDIATMEAEVLAKATAATASVTKSLSAAAGSASASAGASRSEDAGMAGILEVPELASAGKLFRTSRAVRLTEEECEYLVSVRKHIFSRHVIFDFEITNTVQGVELQRVTVDMVPTPPASGAAWATEAVVAAPAARHNVPVHAYVSMSRVDAAAFPATTWACTLRYQPVDVDIETGEPQEEASFDEEFPIEQLRISPADFVIPKELPDFRGAWESIPEDNGAQVQLALPFPTVAEGVSKLTGMLGLTSCQGTGAVSSTADKAQVLLSGVFLDGSTVLVRLQIVLHSARGLVMRAMSRSESSPELAKTVLSSIDV
jgi:coatomer subunit gamma